MNRAERRRQRKKTEKAAKKAKLGQGANPSPDQQTLAIQQSLELAARHLKAGDLPQAEGICQQVLQADPNQPVALHLLGVLARQVGKNDSAVDLITRAIAIKPDYAEAHNNLGNAFAGLGRLDEAVASYNKALAIKPDFAEAHSNLGNSFKELGRLDEAMESFHKALAIKPDYAEALTNFGNAFKKLGRLDEAVDSYGKALAIKPDMAEAHNNLGNVFQDLEKLDEAVASYHKAIAIKPDYAEAHTNLGNALNELGRLDEAVASHLEALAIQPDFFEAHQNLGLAHHVLGRLDEAIDSYHEALAIQPDFFDAHHNLSFTLLGIGREDEGLDEYEWRWRDPSCASCWHDFPQPQWDGASTLDGKTILLWPEQGPQDVTLWASAIPELAARAERCIVATFPKLVSLFARSFPEAEVRPDNADPSTYPGADPDDFDVHLPMGSLFRALRTAPTSTVPAFLVPDPERVAFWKQRLADLGPGPYVGISWKSPVITPKRARNYTRIDEWAPLFALPARFINLQCGEADDDLARAERELSITVHDFEDIDLFDGLDDVAALSAALDLSISVSTAVAAITAGVGTPTWVIAWRQSPWNNFLLAPRGPEVTRFERDTGETWDAVFAAMAERLRDLAG